MTKNHIHIIKMGGTIEFIDPGYENINQQMMKLDTTIDSFLKNMVKPHFTYSIESVCEKDSRDITSEDLKKLVKAIKNYPHENILITHGTFTMKKTAQFLENKDLKNKIILTGSMVPIMGFSVSDAAFNLGFSIASFGLINTGVYICMNGGIFKSEEVEKNNALLRFE
ncbi:asparaginase domain-containing protein [Candidatus Microgenomates bacterium]|nr:asparaginase domain-containing protein [Candidatus Microgenomates bacterium]